MDNLSDLYTTGFFDELASRSLQSARVVLPWLFRWLEPARVIDVGCGVGAWLRVAAELGAGDILGIDGDHVDPAMLMIDPARFVAGDLIATRLREVLRGRVEGPFDLAMCLEFAEHIPFDRAAALVEDLTELADAILFSAAVPFQSGVHHVNEQWPEFWAIQFRARGFRCYDWVRRRVWNNPDVDLWYAQNTLLFAKEGSAAAARLPPEMLADGAPLAFVHPENYLANVLQLYRINGKQAYGEEAEDFRSVTRANARRDIVLPPLLAIARAAAAGPDARNVFPWTRTELGDPEQVADELRATKAALAEEAEARQRAEVGWQQETAQRTAIEQALAAETAARRQADGARRQDELGRSAAEQALAAETTARRQAQALARREAAQRMAAEQGLGDEREARQRAEAAYQAIANATLWKLSYPLRSTARRVPDRTRRVLRSAAEIVWWSLGLRLRRRLIERRHGLPAEHRAAATAMIPLHNRTQLHTRIAASKLFDPEVYLSLHPDLRDAQVDAWEHYLCIGYGEGRHFSNCEVVAQALAELHDDLALDADRYRNDASSILAGEDGCERGAALREDGVRIGVLSNSEGNFYMHEIAELLALGLQQGGIDAVQRDELSDPKERFDLRIFVAPHEFFYIGAGKKWLSAAGDRNTVLYNVEQMHTPWFCRAFPLLLHAPLVLDINFQYAEILRRAGCNVVHFMPGHLVGSPYAQPYTDASDIELLRGYDFAGRCYDWREHDRLADRPIDLLFIGSSSPRRDQALARLQENLDQHRFICVYTRQQGPLTARDHRSTSTGINCALGQRSKIVLNIHRDWLGYFEWSRMVLQGFWQGACVVTDPSFDHPLYQPGIHYLEENPRHMGELVRWLLETPDGREKLDAVRKAGYQNAVGLGSMRVALAPVLTAAAGLLDQLADRAAPRRGVEHARAVAEPLAA